jgi:hypothetical protein
MISCTVITQAIRHADQHTRPYGAYARWVSSSLVIGLVLLTVITFVAVAFLTERCYVCTRRLPTTRLDHDDICRPCRIRQGIGQGGR